MSSQFHLRPVQDSSPSSSPTAESSSPGHHSPLKHSPVSARPRRPLSPSSIRDLDLPRSSDMAQRKYPAPPTGHELMAMFPPAPPETPPETRGGPTSGFFQRQERAFFAQAGKELFRVRVEIDLPQHLPEMDAHGKSHRHSRGDSNGPPRSWPQQLPLATNASPSSIPHHNNHSNHSNHSTSHANHSNHAATHSNRSPVHATPNPSSSNPLSAPPPSVPSTAVPAGTPGGPRTNVPNQRAGAPVPLYPVNPRSPPSTQQSHPQPPPPNLHPSPLHQPGIPLRNSSQESMPPPSTVTQRSDADVTLDDFQSEDAWRRQERMELDAWRRPIPYPERRRAGKHTKRVIVR